MKYTKSCVFSALLLSFMIVIFTFSAQPAEESSALSSPIAEAVVDWLYPNFDEMSAEEQTDVLDWWSHIIRKSAHLAEYTLLGLLCILAMGSIRSDHKRQPLSASLTVLKIALTAILIGIAYAASDELHQRFVSGRSGQLSDVLLDSCGVVAGVMLVYSSAKICNACQRRMLRKVERH